MRMCSSERSATIKAQMSGEFRVNSKRVRFSASPSSAATAALAFSNSTPTFSRWMSYT